MYVYMSLLVVQQKLSPIYKSTVFNKTLKNEKKNAHDSQMPFNLQVCSHRSRISCFCCWLVKCFQNLTQKMRVLMYPQNQPCRCQKGTKCSYSPELEEENLSLILEFQVMSLHWNSDLTCQWVK